MPMDGGDGAPEMSIDRAIEIVEEGGTNFPSVLRASKVLYRHHCFDAALRGTMIVQNGAVGPVWIEALYWRAFILVKRGQDDDELALSLFQQCRQAISLVQYRTPITQINYSRACREVGRLLFSQGASLQELRQLKESMIAFGGIQNKDVQESVASVQRKIDARSK